MTQMIQRPVLLYFFFLEFASDQSVFLLKLVRN